MPDRTTLDMWPRGMREARSERRRHAAKRAAHDENTKAQENPTDTAHGQAYDTCNLSERKRLRMHRKMLHGRDNTSLAKLASSHLRHD
jgi:hypothetical protein